MVAPTVSTPIPDQNKQAGQAVSFSIAGNITDADAGDSIAYSVAGLPLGTGLMINPTTGVLSGTPTQADLDAKPINVTVRATDQGGQFVEQSFALNFPETNTIFVDQNHANASDTNTGDDINFPLRTIGRAFALANPDDTVMVRSGTYAENLTTTRNGTAAQKITVKAYPGDVSPRVVPIANQSHLRQQHPFWVIGEGIHFDGTNPGIDGVPPTGQPNPGVLISASDSEFRGKVTDSNLINLDFTNGIARIRIKDAHLQHSGAYNNGQPKDVGQSLNKPEGGTITDFLIEDTFIGEGGHAGFQIKNITNLSMIRMMARNDHGKYVFGTMENKGNRAGSLNTCTNIRVRDFLAQETRQASDVPTTQMVKFSGQSLSCSGAYFLDSSSGGVAFDCLSNADNPGGYRDEYFDHITVYKQSAEAMFRNDNNGDDAGPIRLRNIVLKDLQNGGSGRAFDIHYSSLRPPPDNDPLHLFHLFGCISDVDYQIRFRDVGGPEPDETFLLSQAAGLHPGSYGNIFIEEPGFPSLALPTSTVPSEALATAATNFKALSANAVTGCLPLTTTTSAVTASQTVPVAEARWFRDNMGWAHLTGDQIYIEGFGAVNILSIAGNTLTVTAAVTCANGAKIWRGASATPRMGASQ